MKRLSTSLVPASAVLALTPQQRHLGMHLPKMDICMTNFSFDREMANFQGRSMNLPDYGSDKHRKLYWRADEHAKRTEAFINKQGYFYMPTLDYPYYKGVQPFLSAEQIRIHFYRHHKAYVAKLNLLIKGTQYEGMPLDGLIKQTYTMMDVDPVQNAIYNNAAQHYNHMLFWKSIHPFGVVMPPDLENAINEEYGSFANFKKAFTDVAMAQFGSGWVFWVWDKIDLKFDIKAYDNAGTTLTDDRYEALVVLDMWEHSFYVDYENRKATYVKNFFEVIDFHWAEKYWKGATNQEYKSMLWQ